MYLLRGFLGALLVTAGLFSAAAMAQLTQLPGSADPNRVQPRQVLPPSTVAPTLPTAPSEVELNIPENAENIPLALRRIDIQGVTAFDREELQAISQPRLNKSSTTMATIWEIIGDINTLYRREGYFLSRAYVAEQDVSSGNVVINAVEGYISDVLLPEQFQDSRIVRSAVRRLTEQRPVTIAAVDELLLRLNDVTGSYVSGALAPTDETANDVAAEPGAVSLILTAEKSIGAGRITADNYGSRFLGPWTVTGLYQASIIPMQRTNFSASTSIPPDELKYAAINHTVPVTADVDVSLFASRIESAPGGTLAANDINSDVTNMGITGRWQLIRQRRHNLALGLTLDGQNSNGDVFGDTPLTRDRIRAARLMAEMDITDGWQGFNSLTITLNKGLSWLGASDEGDANLSRAEADPEFLATQISYQRQQVLPHSFLATFSLAGQYASGPLFSAEEFGYGGQTFGRAYDPSEIIGDHGLVAALELAYTNLSFGENISLQPYAFYDIGKVWNEDTDGDIASAASAGAGIRLFLPYGVNANLGAAFPLTKPAAIPQYGHEQDPRLMFGVGVRF